MADDGEKVIEDSTPQEGMVEPPKPLTEEEKAEKLRRAEERIKQRKLEMQEEERKRAIELEKSRRREGQDLAKIKADIKWREAQKIAEEKKREKREDKLARQRVLEDIARDRANMKVKQAGSNPHSGEETKAASNQASTKVQEPKKQQEAPAAKKDYKEAKLQIRLPSGTKFIQTFGADEPLSAVRLYIDMHGQSELGPFIDLATPYPRKVFTDDEMQMPLRALGLVPSSVVLATKGKDPESGTAL